VDPQKKKKYQMPSLYHKMIESLNVMDKFTKYAEKTLTVIL